MKEKKRSKKILSAMLIAALLLSVVSGCGSGGADGSGKNNAESSGADGSGQGGLSDDNAAMGRYVEEVTDLSDKISGWGNGLYRLNNGNLVISDTMGNFYKTDNNGGYWMSDIRRWRTAMLENQTYIMNIAIGADNTVALIYQADADTEAKADAEQDTDENEGTESNSETEADASSDANENAALEPETDTDTEAGSDADESAESDTDTSEESEEDYEIVLNPQLLLILPDNTEVPVEIELTEDDMYLKEAYIADNGRIFVTMRGSSNIYEVKEDGSSELFLTVEAGTPDLIQFQNNIMVMDGYGYNSLVLYDMEAGEYIEDEALNDFIHENYKDRDGSNIGSYGLYFFFGEDGILYLAGEKGLYRHAIGGGVLERLIDGHLCSLGNPSYEIQGMLALENNEFLALFAGGKMIHYVYNPDISTVPDKVLKAYSLEDNETIRQAINLYQTENPEVYVEFEYGMGGDNSITRDDALKSLNTKIVAGEGPDILILDNMPIDSYIEKGLLLDIKPTLDSLSGEEALFENITGSMEKNGQIFAVPCEVKLPIMMLEKKNISQIKDLEDIADMVVAMREDNPGEDLFGLCSEKSIMRMFSMTCAPAWISDNGEINSEAVQEFLVQTKRIYDAQMDGISDKAVDRYRYAAEYHELYNNVKSFEDSDYVRRSGIIRMNYVGGYYRLHFGPVLFIDIFSILKTEGFENIGWMPMKGQGGNVFQAETLIGISVASKQPELAEDFLKICLGKENQSYFFDSMPVNQAAFDEMLAQKGYEADSEGMWGSIVTDGDDGKYIVLAYYLLSEPEIASYREFMESMDTAYYENDIVEEAVYEEGIDYIQGSKSLADAVEAIEKKISIYMAE